jgi:hypothetical protein
MEEKLEKLKQEASKTEENTKKKIAEMESTLENLLQNKS